VGAKSVLPLHLDAKPSLSPAQAHAHIDSLALVARRTKVVSAHVMGAAAMAADEKTAWYAPMVCTTSWKTCRCTMVRCCPARSGPTRS
jgi:hypothetical protein